MAGKQKSSLYYRCFLCGNVNVRSENEKQLMYKVTKTRFTKWKQVIQKKELRVGSKLCGIHFDADDVVRGRVVSGIFQNYKTHRLAVGVLPKYYLGNFCFYLIIFGLSLCA